jgi:hypothetical protein
LKSRSLFSFRHRSLLVCRMLGFLLGQRDNVLLALLWN